MRFASQMQHAWGLHLSVELVHHGGAGDRKVRGEVGVAVIHVEAVEHGEDLIDHRRIGLSTTISRILREECNPGASDIVAAHEEDNEECPGRRLVLELLFLLQPPHTLLHRLGLLVAVERCLDVVIVVLFVLVCLVPPVPPGIVLVLQR